MRLNRATICILIVLDNLPNISVPHAKDASTSIIVRAEDLQQTLNYTKIDGSINCDEAVQPSPTCVDGKFNRDKVSVPFTGDQACNDVIRMFSLYDDFEVATMDVECGGTAEIAWQSSNLASYLKSPPVDVRRQKQEDVERTTLQEALNYTILREYNRSECYYKGAVLPIFMKVLAADSNASGDYNMYGCSSNPTIGPAVNCDELKVAKPWCKGSLLNRDIEPIPFDGSGACLDVIRTMALMDGEATRIGDIECGDGSSRRLATYETSCVNTRRFVFHYWFNGVAESRSDTSIDVDNVIHNHLHHAQDNVRVNAQNIYDYVTMEDCARWKRVMFREGAKVDMTEESKVYYCTTQDSPFVHVKGWMSGTFLAYNPIVRKFNGTSCPLTYKYRPPGAPPGSVMYGVVSEDKCFLDIYYGPAYGAVPPFGRRNYQDKTAWNN